MFVAPMLFIALIAQLAIPAALIVIIVLLLRREHPDAGTPAAFGAARRHAAWTTGVAALLAVLLVPLGAVVIQFLGAGPRRFPDYPDAGTATADAGTQALADLLTARHLALTILACGAVYVLTHLVGNLTWPRPRGRIRTAMLRTRAVGDIAPTTARLAMWGWVLLLGASAALVPLGRNDGTILRMIVDPDGPTANSVRTFSAAPYPTWAHVAILAAAALALAILAELVLRHTLRRPAIEGCTPADDLHLRRISASRLMRGVQLAPALVASSVLGTIGTALRSVDHTWLALVTLSLAALTPVAALILAVVPVRRTPEADAPDGPPALDRAEEPASPPDRR